MKLRLRDLGPFLAREARSRAGILVHGPDPIAVGLRRDAILAALLGPDAEAEMRLARLAPAQLRADPAALQDALRARGFFPGPRAVYLDDAGDGLADLIASALAQAKPGEDALLLVTAETLPARSKLRKLFEAGAATAALQLFDDPPGRAEVEEALATAGLAPPGPDALQALVALARELDPGSFRQFAERLALYKLGDPAPLTADEIAALAPLATEASVDQAVMAAADGRVAALGTLLARLGGQAIAPTTLCIAAARHFRTLHAAAIDSAGPESALNRARPPVFGPRREAMLGQVRAWDRAGLERAIALLTEADLTLRSASAAPGQALIERTLIRIALQRGQR
ncbi:MAG TPA: DNA polymerase III subunit delta [Paracoccaceae bacterium]|nr:DNA polymerase III subunit delta [Paracoccaceae bacterium]